MLSSPNIKYPSVNAFSASLQSQDIQVQKSCLTILSQIFKQSAIQVSVPYIQATAPQVIQWCLQQKVNHPTNEQQLQLAVESLQLLETMLEIAEVDKNADGKLNYEEFIILFSQWYVVWFDSFLRFCKQYIIY